MKEKTSLIAAVGLAAVLVAGLIVFAVRSDTAAIKNQKPPQLFFPEENFDWGEIIGREPVVRSVAVENRGAGELVISGISSSCMCTSASLKTASGQTPFGGMSHGGIPPRIEARLKPGEAGELLIRYDPLAHGQPDEGLIRRAIYLRTNDPQNREAQITFTALVNIR